MASFKVRIVQLVSTVHGAGLAALLCYDLELPFPPIDGLYLSALPGGESIVGPLMKCTYECASGQFFCEVEPLTLNTPNFADIIQSYEEKGWSTSLANANGLSS